MKERQCLDHLSSITGLFVTGTSLQVIELIFVSHTTNDCLIISPLNKGNLFVIAFMDMQAELISGCD